MDAATPKPKRIGGIVIGLGIFGIIVLVGAVGFLNDGGWQKVPYLTESMPKLGPQQDPGMTSMEQMGTAIYTEPASTQAYATVTPIRQQLTGVKTAPVGRHHLETTIRAVGRVEYNEQRIAHVNLRISGWIEDLFVDYTGQLVRKGQPLFTLYSPDLVTAQDEYLLARRAQAQVEDSPLQEVRQQAAQLVEAARDRLQLWTVTDEQINELDRQGKAQTYLTIFTPIAGHVIEKKAFKGMFVEPRMTVYTIADLSTIWVQAEIYEHEVAFVQEGQSATLTLAAYPGEFTQGQVTYIYPNLNKEARTVKVRLVFPNPDLRLKPDMYGTVVIEVDRGTKLAVPDQAVLDSGVRKVVFVVRGEGIFEPREVTLGSKIGPYYEVVEGLAEGERIVTSGTFLLDSESKLMVSTSAMGALGMGGIQMEQASMGEMDMGGMGMEMEGPAMPSMKDAPAHKAEKEIDGLTLALSTLPAPPRVGENRIRVRVMDADGKPISNAKILLTYTMPMPGMAPATVPMAQSKDSSYDANVNLGMGGQWDLTLTVQRAHQPDVKETFSVIAGINGMPGMSGMEQ